MRLVRTLVVSSLAATRSPRSATSRPWSATASASTGGGPLEVSTLSGPSRLVIDVSTAGVGGSAGGGTATDDAGSLPFTGSRGMDLLVTAVALLVVGAIVIAQSRRTRAS